MSSFARMFTPKDRVFYGLFEEVTTTLKEMSAMLHKALQEENIAARDAQLRALEEWEHKNDHTTHKIFIELGQNFITPFDREDIHALAHSLDDIADYMWSVGKRIFTYHLDTVDKTMIRMSEVIIKCTHALHEAVHELRNMKKIKTITDCCVAINSYENEADILLDEAISALFSDHAISAIELIKRKDLYEELELVTDKCEDAADVIESIIIKYA